MDDSASAQRLKGILSITVLKASGLPKSDWLGENDNYVITSLRPLSAQQQLEQQTELCQRSQVHDGCNPIFNEKFAFPITSTLDALYVQVWDADKDKDDLLASGTFNMTDDTNTDKEWLHIATVPLSNDRSESAGRLELVLHFIPDFVAEYMGRKFNAAQAEVKKKLTEQIVSKMTTMATDKIRGYVGVGV